MSAIPLSITRAQQILLGQADAVVKPYALAFSDASGLPRPKLDERLTLIPRSMTSTVDRRVAERPNPAAVFALASVTGTCPENAEFDTAAT